MLNPDIYKIGARYYYESNGIKYYCKIKCIHFHPLYIDSGSHVPFLLEVEWDNPDLLSSWSNVITPSLLREVIIHPDIDFKTLLKRRTKYKKH